MTLLRHLTSPSTAAKYGVDKEEVIGLFVPNTYEVWWNISPEALTDRMAKEWDKFWNKERTSKLARTRLSKMEVVTLASIVYEETKNVGEMPKIAGVYINRLRRGMPLQACPTAKYAAIDAVLNYTDHKYIYFCAKEDFSGTHYFSSTLAEHNRYAARYTKALSRAGIR